MAMPLQLERSRQTAAPAPVEPDGSSRSRRALGILGRWLAASLACQVVLGAAAVIGWTMAMTRARVLSRWPGQGEARPSQVRRRSGILRRARRYLASGLASWLATWLLLGPAQILWAFSWHAGWNISFTKIYEQSGVGVATAFLGIGGFLAAALLVPMAQARHAVTGAWRTAIELPALGRLVWQRPWSNGLLAAGYVVGSLPLTVAVMAPVFFGQNLEGSVSELRELAGRYWFWVTVMALPFFVGLRFAGGSLYAASLRSVARERAELAWLHHEEQRLISRLPRPWARTRRWPIGLLRGPAVALTLLLWFGFVAQIYVGAFFHDRGPRAWLNQPLLELPWWRTIPSHLQEDPAEVPPPAPRSGPE